MLRKLILLSLFIITYSVFCTELPKAYQDLEDVIVKCCPTSSQQYEQECDSEIAKFKDSINEPILFKNDSYPDGFPVTPLAMAVVIAKNYAAVESLLKNGANVNAPIPMGHSRTILHIATENQYVDLTKLLINYGADVNAQDNYNNTPLHKLASSEPYDESLYDESNESIVETLKDYVRRCRDRKIIAELLIAKGANITLKNNDGKTALDLAKILGKTDIANIIVKAAQQKASYFSKCYWLGGAHCNLLDSSNERK